MRPKRSILKSTGALLLLVLLYFPLAGYLLVFKVRQEAIRHEMKMEIKGGVPEDELVLIVLPTDESQLSSADFQRMHSREFRLNGEMYDMVYQEVKGDSTYHYCVTDEQESLLFANLDQVVEDQHKDDPAQNDSRDRLNRLFSSLYFSTAVPPYLLKLSSQEYSTLYLFSYLNWEGSPESPPPRV